MEVFYKVMFVDDDPRYAKALISKAGFYGFELDYIDNWEEAKTKLENSFDDYVAVILDGRGKLIKEGPGDNKAHVHAAIEDIKEFKGQGRYIPYFVLSAYYEIQENLRDVLYEKTVAGEKKLFTAINEALKESPKFKLISKYPEPFQCFGGKYLDKQYEKLLLNIVSLFENENLKDVENMLFNPCRILLERVFEKITEIDEKVLPYALSNFDSQRPALANCSKYLSGVTFKMNNVFYEPPRKFLDDHISQQIQTIIAVCHPASHDIQKKYTRYTFLSTLSATFDVLIWLKDFIEERVK